MLLALAGDTMLGRGVGEELHRCGPASLLAPEVVELTRGADIVVANLECCISRRGRPWPDRAFHFRAPPAAVEVLALAGVDCVTLANNHALDYGADALVDTLDYLDSAGIRRVGAGRDEAEAHTPAVLRAPDGFRLAVLGLTDHPADFAATPHRPGVAYANLWDETVPAWVEGTVAAVEADAVLVSPHWGPNLTAEPVPHVRRAAGELRAAGAALVAGHSAHVFHGVTGGVLYDLGDFLDDYAVHPVLRNDLGLLWLVEVDASGPVRIEAVPLALDYCHTRLATRDEADWIADRLTALCAALGTRVVREDGRLVVEPGVAAPAETL